MRSNALALTGFFRASICSESIGSRCFFIFLCLFSTFHRFIPKVPGKLSEGGQLQALALLPNAAADSRNWQGVTMQPHSWHSVRWIDCDDPESPNDDLRQRGAALGALVHRYVLAPVYVDKKD